MDPKIIIAAMQETQEHLTRLSLYRSAVLDDCQAQQRLSNEYAERGCRDTSIRLDEAEQSLQQMQALERNTSEKINSCEQLLSDINNITIKSGSLNNKAKYEFKFWNNQLNKARDWRDRASSRVHLAISDVHAAQANYSSCLQHLNSAESALAAARTRTRSVYQGTDKNGRAYYKQVPIDTTSYENAVHSSKLNYDSAKLRLTRAQQELTDAKKEHERAEWQYEGSCKAVNDCKAALTLASSAYKSAKGSLNYASKAFDDAKHADREAKQALEITQKEVSECQNAFKTAKKARQHVEISNQQLELASQFNTSAKQSSYAADISIEQRCQDLSVFDTPMLSA